jgi:CBS domain-containing protein
VPVVDEWGSLAGLVTVSRIVELARDHGHGLGLPLEPTWSPSQRSKVSDSHWQSLGARDAMVSDLVTVTEGTSVRDAARALLDGQVHRAVVLGEDRNVCGVVSAVDFTRLVAERHEP